MEWDDITKSDTDRVADGDSDRHEDRDADEDSEANGDSNSNSWSHRELLQRFGGIWMFLCKQHAIKRSS